MSVYVFFGPFQSVYLFLGIFLVSVLLSAHVERISVSRMQDFYYLDTNLNDRIKKQQNIYIYISGIMYTLCFTNVIKSSFKSSINTRENK